MMVQCRNGSAQHMPRKPKPGPTILRMEYLSTGREVRDATFVDDFEGEVLPIPEDSNPTPLERIRTVSEWERTKSAQRLQRAQDVLRYAGLMQSHAEPKRQIKLIPQGKRKVAQLGDLAVLAPIAPWRRF